MTGDQRFYIIIALLSVIIIPGIGLLWRAAIKWTRIESDMGGLVKSITDLVADKDRTHVAMLEQMREDRTATNSRLEYLERMWIEMGVANRSRR